MNHVDTHSQYSSKAQVWLRNSTIQIIHTSPFNPLQFDTGKDGEHNKNNTNRRTGSNPNKNIIDYPYRLHHMPIDPQIGSDSTGGAKPRPQIVRIRLIRTPPPPTKWGGKRKKGYYRNTSIRSKKGRNRWVSQLMTCTCPFPYSMYRNK
jgi:hypothetical protein